MNHGLLVLVWTGSLLYFCQIRGQVGRLAALHALPPNVSSSPFFRW